MSGPTFPAAASAGGDRHRSSCACLECIDALIAEVSKPLVIPRPRRDSALATEQLRGPSCSHGYTVYAGKHPNGMPCGYTAPAANRATRGPGTGGGSGRRPSGPGRRRGSGRTGGEGAPGGCASAGAALLALAVIALAAAAGLVWLAVH